MIPYNEFRYLYPPRAEKALAPNIIKSYEKRGFMAQPKLNGSCMVIFTNGIETVFMNRHREYFTKPVEISGVFKELHRQTLPNDGNKWMVLVGEYMNKSQKNEFNEVFNHKLVLFDILAFDGVQLLGRTFQERVDLLDKLYGKDDLIMTPDGVKQNKFLYTTPVKDVYRVKTFYDCLTPLWNDLVKIGMMEGLVLKKANAKLENGTGEKNNATSQVKFRKTHKNYAH